MAYFENKEKYLKWAKRRLAKTAKKESLPENSGIFREPKVHFTKSPLSWIVSILVVVLILSLYSLNSGKGKSPEHGKESTSKKTELIPPNCIPMPAKLPNVDLRKIPHASLQLNSIGGEVNGQDIDPETANISLEDSLQKAYRALVSSKLLGERGVGSSFLIEA